jgi:hypothetical protein
MPLVPIALQKRRIVLPLLLLPAAVELLLADQTLCDPDCAWGGLPVRARLLGWTDLRPAACERGDLTEASWGRCNPLSLNRSASFLRNAATAL